MLRGLSVRWLHSVRRLAAHHESKRPGMRCARVPSNPGGAQEVIGSMSKDAGASSEYERKSLLLVDPDPLLRWSVETHLHQWFDVTAAANLKDALASLRNARFEAIILSAALGGSMCDIEAEARARNKNVKIIRLTTGNQPASAAGSVVSLEKPFRLEALAEILGVGALDSGESRHVR